MKYIVLMVVSLAFLAGGCGESSSIYSSLDSSLDSMIGEGDLQVPGLGVIVFKDGSIVYEHFAGLRNVAKNLPIDRNTRLRVASVSKMFTVFGIMQLVEAGKIDLDEDISRYLGFELKNPNFPDEKITVRMLASHTSTLRDGESYSLSPGYSIEEFFKPGGIKYESGGHFAKEDKTFFTYCNLNYGVLGTIIERVSGERFDVYLKNHVLKPMGINADYVVGNLSSENFRNLGTIYRKENGQWTAQADSYEEQPPRDTVLGESLNGYEIGTNATAFSPQGGLRISFAELGNCLEMMMNGGNFRGTKIVREDLFREMCRPQWIYDPASVNGDPYDVMLIYCLGLYQIDGASEARLCEKHDIDLIGHSGEAYGLVSGVYFRPGMKDGVIFMVNGTGVDDERSHGRFSNSFIWEEEIMNPICEAFFAGK
ncbi:MAG: beta-lactamase family protein [Synergistaceae bacterium]|nr:beta-lactamase family protein [Synergistaceae bacterium]